MLKQFKHLKILNGQSLLTSVYSRHGVKTTTKGRLAIMQGKHAPICLWVSLFYIMLEIIHNFLCMHIWSIFYTRNGLKNWSRSLAIAS